MTIHIPFVKRVEMVSVALRIGVSAVKCFDNAVAASDELAFALENDAEVRRRVMLLVVERVRSQAEAVQAAPGDYEEVNLQV